MTCWICRNALEQAIMYARNSYLPNRPIVIPWWQNVVETTALLGTAVLLAVFVPSVTFIFSLVGATCFMTTSYIIPAAMYLHVMSPVTTLRFPNLKKFIAWVFFILGLVIGLGSTVGSIVQEDYADFARFGKR